MAAQSLDAAARTADVAQQQLQDARRPDELRAVAVLGPADRVDELGGLVGPRVLRQVPAHLLEQVAWHPAHPLDHLRRVAGVVAAQHVEHAARVAQRLVAPGPAVQRDAGAALDLAAPRRLVRRPVVAGVALAGRGDRRHALVLPGVVVVRARLGVEAGEHAVEVLGVAEVLAQDGGRVGVVEHVLVEVQLVLQHVVDDRAEEGHVGAGPDGHVQVGQRARPGEARIDVDDHRAARLGLHHPLKAHRMGLGEVRALDDHAVGVLQILHERGGAAAPERRAQPHHGRAVADAGLVLDLHHAERRQQLLDEVVLLVVQRGAAQAGDAHGPGGAPAVLLPLPGLAPGRDDPVGDHVHGGGQVDRLPVGRAWCAVEGVVLPAGVGGELEAGRALRAQPPAADRRVGVALDLHDLLVPYVHVLAAAHRAVRAHRLHHPVGRGRAGPPRPRRGRLGRRPPRRAVTAGELPQQRPPQIHDTPRCPRPESCPGRAGGKPPGQNTRAAASSQALVAPDGS